MYIVEAVAVVCLRTISFIELLDLVLPRYWSWTHHIHLPNNWLPADIHIKVELLRQPTEISLIIVRNVEFRFNYTFLKRQHKEVSASINQWRKLWSYTKELFKPINLNHLMDNTSISAPSDNLWTYVNISIQVSNAIFLLFEINSYTRFYSRNATRFNYEFEYGSIRYRM